jgi:hypothetical protein
MSWISPESARAAIVRLLRTTNVTINDQWEGSTGYISEGEAGRLADAIAALSAGHAQTPRPLAFLAWAVDMFGPVAKLRSEHLLRFVEEAIELAHAEGMEREVFNRVADRVYSRPAGDIHKEIGQAQVCLEMFAENIGISSADEAQREWERVQGIPRTEWERRHAAKAAVGITAPSTLCSDCPPVGYETDRTRCLPCPRRVSDTSTDRGGA